MNQNKFEVCCSIARLLSIGPPDRIKGGTISKDFIDSILGSVSPNLNAGQTKEASAKLVCSGLNLEWSSKFSSTGGTLTSDFFLAVEQCLVDKDTTETKLVVDISPSDNMLGVLPHLNYEPWFAIAEFVDNAVQSHQNSSWALSRPLTVTISIDRESKILKVHDDAGGISDKDLPRACRPAEVPPNRKGLNEFGMGMKSAAFWFCDNWTLESSTVGERTIKVVDFDLHLACNGETEINVDRRQTSPESHFTRLTLKGVHNSLPGMTLKKVKSHLCDIYRPLILSGDLVLKIGKDGEEERLKAHKHPSLTARTWIQGGSTGVEDSQTPEVLWEKDVTFTLRSGKRVRGRAGVYPEFPESASSVGITLYRRGRAVAGTADEKWQPDTPDARIYLHKTSYQRQRLWVELHLDGFEVSHTKDGIKWGEGEEDEFLIELESQLSEHPLDLISQAHWYRSRTAKGTKSKKKRQNLDDAIVIAGDEAEVQVETVLVDPSVPEEKVKPKENSASASKVEHRTVTHEGQTWEVKLQFVTNGGFEDRLYELGEVEEDSGRFVVPVTIYLNSMFMTSHVREEIPESLNPALHLITALAISEASLNKSGKGGKSVGALRRRFNQIVCRGGDTK